MHARAAQARGRLARVRARIAHMVDFHRRDAHALSVSRIPRPDRPALPRFSSARPMSTTCRWEDRSRLGRAQISPRSDPSRARTRTYRYTCHESARHDRREFFERRWASLLCSDKTRLRGMRSEPRMRIACWHRCRSYGVADRDSAQCRPVQRPRCLGSRQQIANTLTKAHARARRHRHASLRREGRAI